MATFWVIAILLFTAQLHAATATAGVFGMLRRGAGFLGIITDGAEEAQVKAAQMAHTSGN